MPIRRLVVASACAATLLGVHLDEEGGPSLRFGAAPARALFWEALLKMPRLPAIKLPAFKLPRVDLRKLLGKGKSGGTVGRLRAKAQVGLDKLKALGPMKQLGKLGSFMGRKLEELKKLTPRRYLQEVGKIYKNMRPDVMLRNIATQAKQRLLGAINGFVGQLVAKAQAMLLSVLNEAISRVASSLGLTVEELQQVVDLQTGRVDMAAAKRLLVSKIGNLITPFIDGKVRLIIDQAYNLIRPFLETASSAAVGAIGTIPVAGGVLAAVVARAFSYGITQLRELALKHVERQASEVVQRLLARGFDALMARVPALRALVERVAQSAARLYQLAHAKAPMVR